MEPTIQRVSPDDVTVTVKLYCEYSKALPVYLAKAMALSSSTEYVGQAKQSRKKRSRQEGWHLQSLEMLSLK